MTRVISTKQNKQSDCRLQFPPWVPLAARRRIIELCTSPKATTDENRQLLARLATYPAMKTEVWNKLPSKPKISEAAIIEWAFTAYTFFIHYGVRTRKPKQGGSSGVSTEQNMPS